jgi:hypothetical protein
MADDLGMRVLHYAELCVEIRDEEVLMRRKRIETPLKRRQTKVYRDAADVVNGADHVFNFVWMIIEESGEVGKRIWSDDLRFTAHEECDRLLVANAKAVSLY